VGRGVLLSAMFNSMAIVQPTTYQIRQARDSRSHRARILPI
jgi:hypothetical protein